MELSNDNYCVISSKTQSLSMLIVNFKIKPQKIPKTCKIFVFLRLISRNE